MYNETLGSMKSSYPGLFKMYNQTRNMSYNEAKHDCILGGSYAPDIAEGALIFTLVHPLY